MKWVQNVMSWKVRHRVFLSEITVDENGTIRPKHERLIKAENSLVKLINKRCLFTYLDASLTCTCPATNNRIEGGINAQLRTMLRNHRGMSIERRIRTTRKTGGLLTGYKPVVLGQRLKALAFTTFKPHSH